jgi:hypothetical protein
MPKLSQIPPWLMVSKELFKNTNIEKEKSSSQQQPILVPNPKNPVEPEPEIVYKKKPKKKIVYIEESSEEEEEVLVKKKSKKKPARKPKKKVETETEDDEDVSDYEYNPDNLRDLKKYFNK